MNPPTTRHGRFTAAARLAVAMILASIAPQASACNDSRYGLGSPPKNPLPLWLSLRGVSPNRQATLGMTRGSLHEMRVEFAVRCSGALNFPLSFSIEAGIKESV